MFNKLLLYFIVLFGVMFAEPFQAFAGGRLTKTAREDAETKSPCPLIRHVDNLRKEEGWEMIPEGALVRVLSFLSLEDIQALASTNPIFRRKVWVAFNKTRKSITLQAGQLMTVPKCLETKQHVSLEGGKLSLNHFEFLAQAKSLRSLSLIGFNEGWNSHIVNGKVFPTDNTASLSGLLRNNTRLVALDLSECDVPSLALSYMAPLFTSLTSLNLSGTQVSCDGLQVLTPHVKGLKRFGISLDCNKKSKDHPKSKSLFTSLFGLKDFDLTVKGSRFIKLDDNFMSGFTNLRSLHIKNEKGGLGKKHALEIAKNCKTLEELALIHFGKGKDKKGYPIPCIDNDVATMISVSLLRLKKLYLINYYGCNTGIGPLGGAALAGMTQLVSLSLYYHRLDTEAAKFMVRSLTKLRELDLRNNWCRENMGFGDFLVSSIGYEAVEPIVSHLPRLTYLGFSGSCVSNAELALICKGLTRLETLAMDDGFSTFDIMLHPLENFSFKGARSIKRSNLPKLRQVSLSPEQAMCLTEIESDTLRTSNPDITFLSIIKPLKPVKPHPMDILDEAA